MLFKLCGYKYGLFSKRNFPDNRNGFSCILTVVSGIYFVTIMLQFVVLL